ncbi:MAG: low molecular weight protein-tyrosine-phosphatase [Huintestinicola sp.]|uniref:low molecular weight protein-tyrosine-phosphatase n=1 Tax=Huintestinicola sp. TaxID=2981661 RepID=UPI003F0CFB02
MIKILFVCHGNICRSTMAQSVFQFMVNKAGLDRSFEIDSAATSTEEIGNPPHYGTVGELRRHNIPVIPHRARQLTKADEIHFDLLIGMDSANIRNMRRIVGSSEKIYKLMTFADMEKDVADPWYTGDFAETYADVKLGCEKLLKKLTD